MEGKVNRVGTRNREGPNKQAASKLDSPPKQQQESIDGPPKRELEISLHHWGNQ